jgi:hypothetical protein
MARLTRITQKRCFEKNIGRFSVFKAHYSDHSSLIVSRDDAAKLSKQFGVCIVDVTDPRHMKVLQTH